MAKLRCFRIAAAAQFAADHQPAAKGCSNGEKRHHVMAATGAIQGFGERKAIGVILDAQIRTQGRRNVFRKLPAIAEMQIAVAPQAGFGRARSG